ncbi:hypothetical protein PAXRUDRAFT_606023 [Paxillus rubicundulus Ve08.2h10]|uniref:Uncharacterized protein n=1 Tax=Paxillus rubicundulus Ve08.2h10 TaxID=930991 RepID=A0A0D0E915_9AGAM|nr:hypothetical protein PAXRUDRAFT_606023 [Paxillus rubicundulus Ve08.2h10]
MRRTCFRCPYCRRWRISLSFFLLTTLSRYLRVGPCMHLVVGISPRWRNASQRLIPPVLSTTLVRSRVLFQGVLISTCSCSWDIR